MYSRRFSPFLWILPAFSDFFCAGLPIAAVGASSTDRDRDDTSQSRLTEPFQLKRRGQPNYTTI
jgi:hypothetical protein